MCGIAGLIRSDGAPVSEVDVARLRVASQAMRHRGPDDDGLHVARSGIAAFAHRRLSIIDPTPEAHQPMTAENGNVIVFNGEIYNYRELAEKYKLRVPPSDTAVLLALLELRGLSILREFRGFFTFAWWNDSKQELAIVRDAFGKKPLYYGAFGGRFVFASELRALIASGLVPFQISEEGLSNYLRFYCVPHPLSILEGVHSLAPGSILRVSKSKVSVEQWYRLPGYDPIRIEYEDAVRETRRILERSVRDRLVSDVPVAAFLSGGIDSNAITALAMQTVSEPLQTFSIGFSSKHVESEARWAKIGAVAYGTRHSERNLTDSQVAGLLPEFYRSMDSPTGDGLNAFLVAHAAREQSPTLKVVLSGVGGDEAFLGYKKYRWLARRAAFAHLPMLLSKRIRMRTSEFLAGAPHSRVRSIMRTALLPSNARVLFSSNEIALLTGKPFRSPQAVEQSPLPFLLRMDIEHYLPDMLLRDLDAMTMSQSLEARAPLLDRELMEFAWQLPLRIKVKGHSKQILADAVKEIVPEAILTKPKTGFELPMQEWLMNGALRLYLDLLLSDDLLLVQDGLLSKEAIHDVYAKFVKGHHHYLKPWTIIALEQWYRTTKELHTDAMLNQPHLSAEPA